MRLRGTLALGMTSSATHDQAPWPHLVADIGGTNARFGLVLGEQAPVTDVAAMACAEHATVEAAAQHYLTAMAQRHGRPMRPARVALALATAIDGDVVKLTNSAWTVSRTALACTLGAGRVLLLNDFEALAHALPGLATADAAAVRWIGSPRPDATRPMAVLGPGTGLGVAACLPAPGGGHLALASEGGHVTLAPADDFEGELLRALRSLLGGHVSAERVLSGIGLPALYRAVCAVRGAAADPLSAEQVTARALEGGDACCADTVESFCAMLGGFAGNAALTLGARGGVFLAGGIAQKLAPVLAASRFRERFEAKGRFARYLAGIATGLVMAPHAALDGAAQALRDAERSAHLPQ